MAEVKKTVTINLEDGLSPRQVAMLVQLVSTFRTENMVINYNNKTVNPKSLMSAMYLAAPNGDAFDVTAEGPEAEAAVNAIEDFLNGRK